PETPAVSPVVVVEQPTTSPVPVAEVAPTAVPTTDGDGLATVAPTATTPAAEPGTPPPPAAESDPAADLRQAGDRGWGVDVGLGTAILLAGGAGGAITTRRRRQLRASTVNSRIVEPSAVTARTEQALRRLAEGERIARLDIALRAAASELIA